MTGGCSLDEAANESVYVSLMRRLFECVRVYGFLWKLMMVVYNSHRNAGQPPVRQSVTKLVSAINFRFHAPIYTIFDPVMHTTIALEEVRRGVTLTYL